MKKIFCFVVVFVAFITISLNIYYVNAALSPDIYFDIDKGPGGGGGGVTPTPKMVYTGIEATLNEKSMGHFIINGGGKNERWDLYVKSNSDGIVDYRDVSNLFLVSHLGETYPIEGYAEYLNGIEDIYLPKFRVLQSKEHFFSGKIANELPKTDDYNVFITPSSFATVHYQNGSKDTNFQLAKATNSTIDNPTYLLYKFDSYVTRYYMFKDSEIGTTSKINSGFFIYNDSISVAHAYTKFNSITELNSTSSSNYYFIYNVLFLH